MNILVIGGGGREHAIAHSISQNKDVTTVFVAPGNGGTDKALKCKNIPLSTIPELLQFSKENNIFFTVVGPEVFLVDGIVDEFQKHGHKIIGAPKKSALLEGSKIFSKKFMVKHGIKTAFYEQFSDFEKAKSYIQSQSTFPIVIKADGLAAGKGVVICETKEKALEVLSDFMLKKQFGEASTKIVVEQFLQGFEASILSVFDGETFIPFVSAKDHKQIFDRDKGPNTGGMGVIAPNPYFTEKHFQEFQEKILKPTLEGIKKDKLDFQGFLFFGLMIQNDEVYLLEYNVRLGDPETQAVLPLLGSDFFTLLNDCVEKRLSQTNVVWDSKSSCCVTIASGGYPGSFSKGYPISGLENSADEIIFHAGTKRSGEKVVTNGGRVLNVVAVEDTLKKAHEKAYKTLHNITFDDIYFRKDIGRTP